MSFNFRRFGYLGVFANGRLAIPTAELPFPKRRPLGATDQGLPGSCEFSNRLRLQYRHARSYGFEGPTSGDPEIANGPLAIMALA